jgi:hypothetical protein
LFQEKVVLEGEQIQKQQKREERLTDPIDKSKNKRKTNAVVSQTGDDN